jgi:class 3 adenylate cyclase
MSNTQYIASILEIINQRVEVFKGKNSITNRNSLPETGAYPLKDNQWFKIIEPICIFADIKNSTKLTAETPDDRIASIFEFFSSTAVRIFHAFDSSYIDIKGDGVFALFNSNQVFRSIAAAITFKTFAAKEFLQRVQKEKNEVELGFHIGIDCNTILVKQVGLKDAEERDSRSNEVWAGRLVNMSSKLASRSKANGLLVSDRFFKKLNNEELVVKSCGCTDGQPTGEKKDLWNSVDLTNDEWFDFDTAYLLKSVWCETHGEEWCNQILALDK